MELGTPESSGSLDDMISSPADQTTIGPRVRKGTLSSWKSTNNGGEWEKWKATVDGSRCEESTARAPNSLFFNSWNRPRGDQTAP